MACGAVGCGPVVIIRADLAVAFAVIQKSSITLCRSGNCSTGIFSTLNAAPEASGLGFSIPQLPDVEVGARAPDVILWPMGDGTFQLEVAIGSGGRTPVGGDQYRVEVKNEAGEPVAAVDRAVTYTRTYPNGPACAPECLQAQF